MTRVLTMLTLRALAGCGVGGDEPWLDPTHLPGVPMVAPADGGAWLKSPGALEAEQAGVLRAPVSPVEGHFFYPVELTAPPSPVPVPCRACW